MDSPIRRTPGVLEAEVDGDRVLMHPDDFAYYGLSQTGAEVWLLVDGSRTRTDIVNALAADYDAPLETIRADVDAFLAGMAAARLIASDG